MLFSFEGSKLPFLSKREILLSLTELHLVEGRGRGQLPVLGRKEDITVHTTMGCIKLIISLTLSLSNLRTCGGDSMKITTHHLYFLFKGLQNCMRIYRIGFSERLQNSPAQPLHVSVCFEERGI